MKPKLDPELLAELEELGLEAKQYLSDIAFLEDELRFFKQLFNDFLPEALDASHLQQTRAVSSELLTLEAHRSQLREKVEHFKILIENILRNDSEPLSLSVIENNAAITNEIKTLFARDRAVKKHLYALVEELMKKRRRSHLLPDH